jgi:hypothetical protein
MPWLGLIDLYKEPSLYLLDMILDGENFSVTHYTLPRLETHISCLLNGQYVEDKLNKSICVMIRYIILFKETRVEGLFMSELLGPFTPYFHYFTLFLI